MPISPRKPERPTLWIVAGPNGSGKSSFYNRSDIEGWGGSVWIINPDLLTASIVEREGIALAEANLAAVQRVEAWLYSSLDVYQTIGVETVLSSGKYRRLVSTARAAGFIIKMIYVTLDSVEQQVERIRIRVAEGGHDVPTDRIATRRQRSFEQLCWFFREVDDCYIFVNSGADPVFAAAKLGDCLACLAVLPDDLRAVLEAAGIEMIAMKDS